MTEMARERPRTMYLLALRFDMISYYHELTLELPWNCMQGQAQNSQSVGRAPNDRRSREVGCIKGHTILSHVRLIIPSPIWWMRVFH